MILIFVLGCLNQVSKHISRKEVNDWDKHCGKLCRCIYILFIFVHINSDKSSTFYIWLQNVEAVLSMKNLGCATDRLGRAQQRKSISHAMFVMVWLCSRYKVWIDIVTIITNVNVLLSVMAFIQMKIKNTYW